VRERALPTTDIQQRGKIAVSGAGRRTHNTLLARSGLATRACAFFLH
jgi:3-deoxy-D-manno-octulosonic acid (KDO) 8-phosphate synthase